MKHRVDPPDRGRRQIELVRHLVQTGQGRGRLTASALPAEMKGSAKTYLKDVGKPIANKLAAAADFLDLLVLPRPSVSCRNEKKGQEWFIEGLPVRGFATVLNSKDGRDRQAFVQAAVERIFSPLNSEDGIGPRLFSKNRSVFFGPGTTTFLFARELLERACPIPSVSTTNFEVALLWYLMAAPSVSVSIPCVGKDEHNGLVIQRGQADDRNWGDISPETIDTVNTAVIGFRSLNGNFVESDSHNPERIQLLQRIARDANDVIMIGEGEKIQDGARKSGIVLPELEGRNIYLLTNTDEVSPNTADCFTRVFAVPS